MFTNSLYKTPEEFFKMSTEYFSKFPKNEKEIKEVSEKVKTVIATEVENTKDLVKTLSRVSRGDATAADVIAVTGKVKDSLNTLRFASMMAVPGAVFMLPVIAEINKEYDLDLIPKSVSKEFNI